MSGVDALTLLALGGRTAAAVGIGWVLVAIFRAIARVSPALSRVVAAGIAARALLGVVLFVVSYFQLPFLRSLQLGGGFWALAPDAAMYFRAAVDASRTGIMAMPSDVPSPAFVAVLAWWMAFVGFSPSAAILLNLGVYVLICRLILFAIPTDRPRIAAAAIFGFTWSPALVLFGSQPLKDAFFALLIVVVCVAVPVLTRTAFARLSETRPADWFLGSAAVLSMYLMASIRPYYPVFLLVGLAAALAAAGLKAQQTQVLPGIGKAIVILALAFSSWAAGLGPYSSIYLGPMLRPIGITASVATPGVDEGAWAAALDQGREAFIRSGGATNFGSGTGKSALERARATLTGVLVLLVPMTVLKSLGVVGLSGGTRLLLIADIDTLFIDFSLVWLAIVLFRRPRTLQFPYLVFTVAAAGLTLLSMAYVVTNFGTMWRLRLMVTVPLWMLPLALAAPAASTRSDSPPTPSNGRVHLA